MKNARTYAGLWVGVASLIAMPVLAAPPPGKGKPPVEDEFGNNLSVPAEFIGVNGPILRLDCSTLPTAPYGPQYSGFPIDPSQLWWVQKTEATWQAACVAIDPLDSAPPIEVTADWGDNLTGEGSLKAGKPLRVEMTLTDNNSGAKQGYIVEKLTPDLLDRLATYGTKGDSLEAPFNVYADGAVLTIETCADTACEDRQPNPTVIPMTAEINAIGKVVYGYNWGVSGRADAPAAGIYKLTFSANNTRITSVLETPPAQLCAAGDNCTYVIITVGTAGGGSGGKGKPVR
jgi:hypothetical protein